MTGIGLVFAVFESRVLRHGSRVDQPDIYSRILRPLFLALLATTSRTMRIDQLRQSPAPSFVTNVGGIR